MTRYNQHRRDANHKQIVGALRGCGVSVRDASQLGDDGADLILGIAGRDYQAELKSDNGKLSDGQSVWARHWRGQVPLVLRSVTEAIDWANRIRCALEE